MGEHFLSINRNNESKLSNPNIHFSNHKDYCLGPNTVF